MVIYWGWSGRSHDAALAIMKDGELVYASQSERYTRFKNEKDLSEEQVNEALEYGEPDEIYFYEKPWLKKTRQWFSGQQHLIWKSSHQDYLGLYGIDKKPHSSYHHRSHAAYGFYTSPFDNADILVVDSIGEFETLSYWQADTTNGLKKISSQIYPHSVGLWYSAMAQRIGLKPQEQEYILMAMAAVGDPDKYYDLIIKDFFHKLPGVDNIKVKFKKNLHRGCLEWRPEINTVQDYADIAAATQRIYEEIFQGLVDYTSRSGNHNLVVVGGTALNCVANYRAYSRYDNVWIPPNPGDGGSSIGAILAYHPGKIDLKNALLGTEIPGEYPVDAVLTDLIATGISAVASGRTEFGPRALGNRSILADPRITDIQDQVNKMKNRQSFRPFAAAILSEHASSVFQTPCDDWESKYMQYATMCKLPDLYPGVVHFNNTSRVQTVHPEDQTGFRKLLERWYAETGCPVLLNTSLNTKGEPIVNSKEDAERWSALHNLTVRI